MAVGDRLEVVQYQGEAYQAVEADGLCVGCESYSRSEVDLCNGSSTECRSAIRADGKEVIWVKLQKEQPVVKFDTVKDIRVKAQTLQKEIYKLVEAFEDDTGMVVHGVNLVHTQVIGDTSSTYDIDLDVRLN